MSNTTTIKLWDDDAAEFGLPIGTDVKPCLVIYGPPVTEQYRTHSVSYFFAGIGPEIKPFNALT